MIYKINKEQYYKINIYENISDKRIELLSESVISFDLLNISDIKNEIICIIKFDSSVNEHKNEKYEVISKLISLEKSKLKVVLSSEDELFYIEFTDYFINKTSFSVKEYSKLLNINPEILFNLKYSDIKFIFKKDS